MKIYIAGHNGMVGSAIHRNLEQTRNYEIITASRTEMDLRDQSAVQSFFRRIRPDIIVIAAAQVGGILANRDHPWPFLYDNLMIEANLIQAAHENDVQDEAVRFVIEYDGILKYDLINVGAGEDLTIKELAESIQKATGPQGAIEWDTTKPDGTPRKLMDVSRINELG